MSEKKLGGQNATPWITYEAILFLYQHQAEFEDKECFEWGCGESTLFLSNMFAKVNSVEHDKTWYQAVNDQIQKQYCKNINLRLVPVTQYGKIKSNHVANFFDNYVNEIRNYRRNSFWFVMIDGRAREHCLEASKDMVKVGGYIMFDNSDRKEYSKALKKMDGKQWERIDFKGPGRHDPSIRNGKPLVWTTTVFRRVF